MGIADQIISLKKAVKEKMGIDEEKFDAMLKEKKTEIKKRVPTAKKDELEKRAFLLLKAEFKKQLQSPAKSFNGIVLYAGRKFDMVRQAREDALKQAAEDMESAIASGVVDAEGFPLDTRPTFASGAENRNYGKRLPKHSWIRNFIGVCVYEDEPRLFRLVYSEDEPVDRPLKSSKIDMHVPLFCNVEFRANVAKTQRDERFLQLNKSKYTEFVETGEQIDVMKLLSSEMLEPFVVRPEELQDYYIAHENDNERFVIVRGIITNLDTEPVGTTDNCLMTLDSEEGEFEFEGVRCWVPPYIIDTLEVGEGSVVIVTGQAGSGKLNEEITYTINVGGIYPVPGYEIPLSE